MGKDTMAFCYQEVWNTILPIAFIFSSHTAKAEKQAVLSGLNEDLFLFPLTLHTLPSPNVTKWQKLIDYWYWYCCAYLYEIKYTVANFEIVASQTALTPVKRRCWFMTLLCSCRDSGSSLCCGSSLSNRCILLSCIAVHGRLAGCSDSIGLGLLCVYVRVFVCAGVWQLSRFEDHLEIWCIPRGTLTKRSRTNLHEGAKAAKQKVGTRGEHILLCCLCIYWQALAGMPFDFQSFCYREFEWTVCLITPSCREHVEEKHWSEVLPGVWVTSCSSFPARFFPSFRKLHKHHLSQHRT